MRKGKLNEIIRLAMAGDTAAQEELCRLYAKTILFQAKLLVNNKSDAEDVAQKVMIEMLRGITSLNSAYAFRSWLQRIIVNASSRHNMQTKREFERSEDLEKAEFIVDESLDARPAETAENRDFSHYIHGYLDQLPKTQAIVLVLYYYEQLSYKEIAGVLEVSIGAVSSTMSKAKKNLKKLLKDNANSGAFGIVYTPPAPKRSLRRVVCDEVEAASSDAATERLMGAAKITIAAGAITAGAVGAGQGVAGGIAAAGNVVGNLVTIVVGAVLLSGVAVTTAIILLQPAEEVTLAVTVGEAVPLLSVEADAPPVIDPDIEVVYSINTPADAPVAGEDIQNVAALQPDEVPSDPLTAKMVVNAGEKLVGWTITDETGSLVVEGTTTEMDITSFDLKSGRYLVTWDMLSAEGAEFEAYWKFDIS